MLVYCLHLFSLVSCSRRPSIIIICRNTACLYRPMACAHPRWSQAAFNWWRWAGLWTLCWEQHAIWLCHFYPVNRAIQNVSRQLKIFIFQFLGGIHQPLNERTRHGTDWCGFSQLRLWARYDPAPLVTSSRRVMIPLFSSLVAVISTFNESSFSPTA